MLTYSPKNVEDDVFAFEGIKIKVTDETETSFIQLYSTWADMPMGGDKTVNDFQIKIDQYKKDCLLPAISAKIPVDVMFVLCAGHKGGVLDILVATNKETEFKAASVQAMSKDSSYTAICALIGTTINYIERNSN